MELYQLKTFVKVADEGHLTRAAQQLYTSQPAISAHIKALEEELGVTLFQRTPKGMQLTPEGQLLYEQAKITIESANSLKQQAKALQNELVGDFKLAVHTDFTFMRVGELHQILAAEHPRVRLSLIQSMSCDIIPELRKGNLDGGFFFGPCRYADLTATQLQRVPMAIVAPIAWKDQVCNASLLELANFPWIYTSADCPFQTISKQLFGKLDKEPTKVAYTDSEDAVRELIRSGVGLSLLREDDAIVGEQKGYACRWLGETPDIALQFATQKRRASEPMIKAMSQMIQALWLNEAMPLSAMAQ